MRWFFTAGSKLSVLLRASITIRTFEKDTSAAYNILYQLLKRLHYDWTSLPRKDVIMR